MQQIEIGNSLPKVDQMLCWFFLFEYFSYLSSLLLALYLVNMYHSFHCSISEGRLSSEICL